MKPFQREGLVVLVVALSALAQAAFAGIARLLRSGAEAELAQRDRENAELQFQYVRAADPSMRTEVPAPARWQLASEADVAGTMQLVQELADAAGVVVDDLKAAPGGGPGKQTFQFVGRGAPRNVCSFLAAVEQHDRLLVVESGRAAAASSTLLGVEVAIATYHRGGAR